MPDETRDVDESVPSDGGDATFLPGDPKYTRPYKRHHKMTPAELEDLKEQGAHKEESPLANMPAPQKPPMILLPDKNPTEYLAALFDMNTAAYSLMIENFEFKEIYATLIDIFRNDGDPKVRMQASDRIIKMIRDAMVGSGALGKVVETAKIRSPDGTVAERATVTRHIMRSFEESSPHARKQVRNEAPNPQSGPDSPDSQEGGDSDSPVAPVD